MYHVGILASVALQQPASFFISVSYDLMSHSIYKKTLRPIPFSLLLACTAACSARCRLFPTCLDALWSVGRDHERSKDS